MAFRRLAIALLGLSVTFACGPGAEAPGEGDAAPEATPIAGRYEVSGVTVAVDTGHKRDIAGTVILATEGDTYTATFNLATTYPDATAEIPLAAEVIGKGEGAIEGRTLRGTAHTQLVTATVPGVDPAFAYIPRTMSTRIVSSSLATISADGIVSIEIENRPAAGETYTPTRTTLRGSRVSAAAPGRDPTQAVAP